MSKTLTEGKLADEIAKKLGIKKAEVRRVMDAQKDVVVKGLKTHDAVATPLGRFKVKKIPAKKGGKKIPNPFKPGETIITKSKPASKRIKFFASSKTKKLI